jgi:hypothetical protein
MVPGADLKEALETSTNRALSLFPRLQLLVFFEKLKNILFSLYYFVKRNDKMPTIALLLGRL